MKLADISMSESIGNTSFQSIRNADYPDQSQNGITVSEAVDLAKSYIKAVHDAYTVYGSEFRDLMESIPTSMLEDAKALADSADFDESDVTEASDLLDFFETGELTPELKTALFG